MKSMPTPACLAIVGPTATGKSSIALRIARHLGDLEIVTVDSMQVYRGMDIGTAKPTAAHQAEVPHHLLDLVDVDESFTVRDYQEAAADVVAAIASRGHRPLFVGGTGLYLRAVVDRLEIPKRYPEVRAELDAEPDTAALFRRLNELDPVAASRMEPGNRRRIVRALEVTVGAGRPFSSYGPGLEDYPDTDVDVIALDLPRDLLAVRIADRYDEQMRLGFLDEVALLAARPKGMGRTATQALGYRQLLAHLAGEASLDDALQDAIIATRRFARRQRSWFARDPRIEWFDASDPDRVTDVLADRWRNPVLDTSTSMGD